MSLRRASGTSSETISTSRPGAPGCVVLHAAERDADDDDAVNQRRHEDGRGEPVARGRDAFAQLQSRGRSSQALLGAYAALEGGNYHISNIEPELLVEFTNSCRTRDVDLGHEAADDVDADEHHAPLGERRTDLRRQPAIALVEFASDAFGAGGQIAAIVGGSGIRASA